MRFLIAPNAFKGTVEADEAARLIGTAILAERPQASIVYCPIADGGDGTCELLGNALGLEPVYLNVLNALGRPKVGYYFPDTSGSSVYMDVSTASGIKDISVRQRNPWIASTFGTGELVRHAVQKGIKKIVLGLGGSATVDLGLGMLGALGFVFLDKGGREIPMFSEGFIDRVAHIQRPIDLPHIEFICLCDVNNTFYGQQGAIPVFGPQKGLKKEDLDAYEFACDKLIHLLAKKSGKPIQDQPGYGAAGGIAFGLSFFFPVEIRMGARWFFEQVDMTDKIKDANLVITGEGRYDSQSAGGKGSYELLQLAKQLGKKTVLITSGADGRGDGFDGVWTLPDLDFGKRDFRDEAKKNLVRVVTNHLTADHLSGLFETKE